MVTVTSARTAAPATSPVDAFTPDGMSTATTGAPAPLIRSISAAVSSRGAPFIPVPSSASTIRSGRSSTISRPSELRISPAIFPSPDDLDLLPRERASDAEAERFAYSFLAGEPARVALRRVLAGVAVRALRLGEAPLAEALVPRERAPDPLDLDQVGADPHRHQ